MQRLEVSGAVRLIYKSLGVKGLKMVFVFESTWRRINERRVRILMCEEELVASFVELSRNFHGRTQKNHVNLQPG